MYYYTLLLMFVIAAAIITIDPNVTEYVDFLFKYIRNKLFVYKWILLNDPRNPIVKYLIWRRSVKLAKELQKELAENSKKDVDDQG